ncbi:MAG: ATP-binding cassette domain-containing protein [Legionella sp.]
MLKKLLDEKSALTQKKHELSQRLSTLYLPEIIHPKFILNGIETNQTLVSIREVTVGYVEGNPILRQLNCSIRARERSAIHGANGSGKSTLIKAILHDQSILKHGDWTTNHLKEIGYLDQHYSTLSENKTVWEFMSFFLKDKNDAEIRNDLNDFLFRKNEEVHAFISTLSGGEKARLCLAQIAAVTPKLLVLDEMTNNLDRETRAHVIQVLKEYPGALIVISHDADFLAAIKITNEYEIKNGLLQETL